MDPDRAPVESADRSTDGAATVPVRALWQRMLWLLAGFVALATGIVGIVVPLLPTTPLVLLAAFCFSRGSERWERWLLAHPRLGPMVRDWRAYHAVPLRAKQLATLTMTLGCAWAAWRLPAAYGWMPAAACIVVASWLWRLPTRRPDALSAAPADRAAPGR